MLPKKILLATDGSEYASIALENALLLAEKFSSSIGLLYVVNIRQLEGPFISDLSGAVGVMPFLNFQKQVRELLYHKGEAVLANLLDYCMKKGVPAETELLEGVVSRVVCKVGKAYDLICLGRHGEHASWKGLMMGSTVEEVARGSSRPVLVSQGTPGPIRRILLPYDGSQTASASLSLAVEMAMNLEASLTVLVATGNSEEGEELLEEAGRYVEKRDLQVSFTRRVGDSVSTILEISETGYDLVVMGAYGHSRLRELFLGSTTTGVLSRIKIPVLLYR